MSEKQPRDVLRNLPLPGLFFAAAGLWIVVQLVFHIGDLDLITIATTAIGGLLFAAVMTALAAVNRRRLGGRQQATDFTRALRTGTPPAEAETTRWQDELDRLDRTRTRQTLIALGCSVLPIGLGIWGLFDPDARPIAILLLALFIGLDVAVVLALPGQRRRTERLRTNLDAAEHGGVEQ